MTMAPRRVRRSCRLVASASTAMISLQSRGRPHQHQALRAVALDAARQAS